MSNMLIYHHKQDHEFLQRSAWDASYLELRTCRIILPVFRQNNVGLLAPFLKNVTLIWHFEPFWRPVIQ